MANTAKLRERARAYELRDQWREAIGIYRELLEAEGGEADIGTYNKIGDLHLRLNETEQAVQSYESAVNAYVDVGLYNNAIALCRKIQRIVPGRASTYLRLGQISAAKGFFADARQNFLEYAERMRKAGKLDAAFAALKEFADLTPDPADIRRLLADQLLAHGRKEESIEQLRLLLLPLVERGDADGAEEIRRQILAIDPQSPVSPLQREGRPSGGGDDFGAALDHGTPPAPSRAPAPPSAPADDIERDEPPAAGLDGVQVGAALDHDYGNVELEVAPLAGLETTSLDMEPPPTAAERAVAADDDDLPLIGFDDEPAPPPSRAAAPGPRAADPSRFGEVTLGEPLDFAMGEEDEDDAEPLPLLDEDGPADDLPLLDVGEPLAPAPRPAPAPAPAAPPRDRLEVLREQVAAAPEDHAVREELVAALHDRGLGHEVPAVLDGAHRALAQRARFLDAILPLTELIRMHPDNPALLQKRVEYAFRSGQREAQVSAYFPLGRHFTAAGERAKAEAVFQRIVELEPDNQEARAALAELAPPPAAAPARGPGDDYIDLGELILGGEDERQTTTRFVVEEKEPSGDEDKDFAEMLAHFRQKVAENIEVEDVESHYDLGLAFKEMGLLDEAIAEFQVALRGGANPLATLEILGQCFVEKAQYAVAARVLDRATRIPGASDADLVGVLYQLGRAHEALGKPKEAIELYERALAVDIRFRDTAQRIEALKSGAAPL
jgi:tetratricopeptide (TPR) repeat protein